MALRPDHANEPLILATGAVVIWWGRIEGMLFQEIDFSLRHHPAVKKAGICQPLEIATERLIRQWAKAARRVAEGYPDVQTEISALKVELRDCAETRNVIVHGFWDYPSPDQDPNACNVLIVKPNRDGTIHRAAYQVTYKETAEFHNRLAVLYHRLLVLTLQMPFRDMVGRPKVGPVESESSPSADPSPRPAPNRKRGLSLHRDSE